MKIAYNSATSGQKLSQVLHKITGEEPHHHRSRKRVDLPAACATICAMPTAD